MDSRVPTDVEYLNSLRAEVKLAFFKSTGRKLQVSDTRTNPYFKKLRQDIINKLSLENNAEHKPPEVGTIIKFLCKEESVDFTPTNIMIFEDYVFAVKEIEKLSNQVYANNIIHGLNSKGARLINSVFRDNLNKDRDITYTDFYIGKKDKDCQWYGVVRNWDYKRESVNTVKNEILKCFSGESRIAAVITGPGGCGKSTFLRRLAIDCIDEAFRILWIDDFGLFCNDLLHIGNNTEKYVIFLDDWPSVIKSSDLVTFLNRISNYNNVRVIIGDRLSSDEKGYEKYLSGKNVFELPTSENEKIISKIIALNRSWRKSADKILPSTSLAEIYNAPLYMILFVFARDSEGLEYTDIKDIASIFRDIVASDLKRISELYKGLALALYYWSCIYIKYNIHISWEAFLKLADHYNGDMKISKRLFDFNQNTFIHQILFHYVSIKGFLNPDLLNVHIIIFHHNLLVEEGLSSMPIHKDWDPFDFYIICDIAEVLWQKDERISASDLIKKLLQEEDFKLSRSIDDVQKELFESMELGKVYSFGIYDLMFYESFLESLYENAKSNTNDTDWENNVMDLLYFFDFNSYESWLIILKKIIELGCTSLYVLKAYNHLLDNKPPIQFKEIYISKNISVSGFRDFKLDLD